MREYRDRTDDPIVKCRKSYMHLVNIKSQEESLSPWWFTHTLRIFLMEQLPGILWVFQTARGRSASPQSRCDYAGAMHNAEGLWRLNRIGMLIQIARGMKHWLCWTGSLSYNNVDDENFRWSVPQSANELVFQYVRKTSEQIVNLQLNARFLSDCATAQSRRVFRLRGFASFVGLLTGKSR